MKLFLLILALYAGYSMHPYETCSKKYMSVEDISECIYLLKSGKAR